MSIFTISGVEYPVTLPVTLRRNKLGHQRRAFSQRMRTSLHSNTNIVARSWDIQMGHLTDAEAATLETGLTTGALAAGGNILMESGDNLLKEDGGKLLLDVLSGIVEIAGDVIGDTVTCIVSDISRQDGQISDAVTLQATFEEVLS